MNKLGKTTKINYSYIVPLSSYKYVTGRKTGFKASRLSMMISRGFPVPHGYAITVKAFEDFCNYNNISIHLTTGDNQEVSKKIIEGRFQPDFEADIRKALSHFPSNDQIAIRSSSIVEDGVDFSMAGQLQTYLCTQKNDVLNKIKLCWSAMFRDTVVAYAKKNEMSYKYKMGVILQTQINSHYSGVIFTMDPLTRSTDFLILEWTKGLGEKLVSGEITPERNYIKRSSPVFPDNIPAHLCKFLKDLYAFALQAEDIFKHPVDIEWCVDESGLHILQARPVTALSNTKAVLWTNVNMTENFPHPMTPFAWSIVDMFYTSYMKSLLHLFGWSKEKIDRNKLIISNLIGIHRGRIYYNLSSWYEIIYFLPFAGWFKKFLDNYIGQKIPYSFEPFKANKTIMAKLQIPFRIISFFFHFLHIFITAESNLENFEKKFFNRRKIWRQTPYNVQNLEELIETLKEIMGFVETHYGSPGIADFLVMIFPGLLATLINKWFPETNMLSARLLQGLNVKSMEPTALILKMSQEIKANQDYQELLLKGSYSNLEARLDDKLKKILNDFMEKFGGRCYNECMINSPTFEERHDLFWDLVKKYQRKDEQKNSISIENLKAENRKNFTRELVSDLSIGRKLIFLNILRNAQNAVKLRETGRIFQSLIFGEIRAITLELGRQLKELGYVNDAGDIFYLEFSEIENLLYGKFHSPESIPSLISLRKETCKKNNDKEPPEFFILDKGDFFKASDSLSINITNNTILQGTGVSAGKAQGKAVIISDPTQDNRLQPGDILVTRSTDPGWTPLFLIAGGLILERGGLLSHGAIVAREFGIPAIVGVDDATKILKDGDFVSINGNTGEIQILSGDA
jgi:phosphoenolpyruvate synthase/pyruvate phosphate dikinase